MRSFALLILAAGLCLSQGSFAKDQTCENWSESSDISPAGKRYIIKYLITIKKDSKIRGWMIQRGGEFKTMGQFEFEKGRSFVVTGSAKPKDSDKKFYLAKGEIVKFVIKDRSYMLIGGQLNRIDLEALINTGDLVVENIRPSLTCWSSLESGFTSIEPVPVEEREITDSIPRASINEIEEAKRKLNRKGKKLGVPPETKATPYTESSSPRSIEEAASRLTAERASDRAKGGWDTAPARIRRGNEQGVCDAEGVFVSRVKGQKRSPISLYGELKNRDQFKAYHYDYELGVDIPIKAEESYFVNSNSYDLVGLEVPYIGTKARKVFPVRSNQLAISSLRTKLGTSKPRFNILLVGDANSVAFSGIEQIDRELDITRSMRIEWVQVLEDGTLTSLNEYQTFASVSKDAKIAADRSGGKKLLLSGDQAFSTFLENFEKKILSSHRKINHVIWIKDSYRLPLTAPKSVEKFITSVHSTGNILRDHMGNPRKWLYVLSGKMPGKSAALLTEPFQRAKPSNPGDVDIEREIRSDRRLLGDPKRLSRTLNLSNLMFIKSDDEPAPTDRLFVSGRDDFWSVGLLLSREGLELISDGLQAQKECIKNNSFLSKINTVNLFNLQSNSAGEPEIFFGPVTKKLSCGTFSHSSAGKMRSLSNAAQKVSEIKAKVQSVSASLCGYFYINQRELGLSWF